MLNSALLYSSAFALQNSTMTNNSSNATNGGADIETAGTKTNPTESTFPKASGTTIGFVQELGSWLKHHQGLLQAILTWLILCVPGNIVTLVLYFKLHSESDMKADEVCMCNCVFLIFNF